MPSFKIPIARKVKNSKVAVKKATSPPPAIRPLLLVDKLCSPLPVVKKSPPAAKPGFKKNLIKSSSSLLALLKPGKDKTKQLLVPEQAAKLKPARMIPRPNSEVFKPSFVVSKTYAPKPAVPRPRVTVRPAARLPSARLGPLAGAAVSGHAQPKLNILKAEVQTMVVQDRPAPSGPQFRPFLLRAPPSLDLHRTATITTDGPVKTGAANGPVCRFVFPAVHSSRRSIISSTTCSQCDFNEVTRVLPDTPSGQELADPTKETVSSGVQTIKRTYADRATTTGSELEKAQKIDAASQTEAPAIQESATEKTRTDSSSIGTQTDGVTGEPVRQEPAGPSAAHRALMADLLAGKNGTVNLKHRKRRTSDTNPGANKGMGGVLGELKTRISTLKPSHSASSDNNVDTSTVTLKRRKRRTSDTNPGANKGMGGVLGELKTRLSTLKPSHSASSDNNVDTAASSPPSALLQRRPRVQKENVQPQEEVPELARVFARRLGGQPSLEPSVGGAPTVQNGQFQRPALRSIGDGNRVANANVNANVMDSALLSGANSHNKTVDTPFGKRRIGRVVVPAFDAETIASQDPRVQLEIDALRAKAKLGRSAGLGGAATGTGASGFLGGRELSLRAFGTLLRNKKENGA
ncbi:hypothetical protein C8J57DRAFT_1705122 [Mycena rebaudengoi]|nr:hypothetical protein C8J57DRAFT_1705122 [Mycena rebaudengoi]